ncbi:MAG: group III truncated hemoglobin [Flavobacteriales bacterium]|jgi:hemoglobin|nr:group III truncated hemoglobin [Flavobacteriales bacterium]
MKDIQTREDIALLVSTFYKHIRQDEKIGFYFNKMIVGEKAWVHHEEKLTNFWESHLLQKNTFRGNPLEAHRKVDKHFENRISTEDFGHWMNNWFLIVDALFEGEIATLAKNKARNMSTFLFMDIYNHRNTEA